MSLQIAFVSSEVHPYSKTGGLADVAGALPAALARIGLKVLVISPWYSSLKPGRKSLPTIYRDNGPLIGGE